MQEAVVDIRGVTDRVYLRLVGVEIPGLAEER